MSLGIEPVLIPHQINRHDDADLRMDEHENFGDETEFGICGGEKLYEIDVLTVHRHTISFP